MKKLLLFLAGPARRLLYRAGVLKPADPLRHSSFCLPLLLGFGLTAVLQWCYFVGATQPELPDLEKVQPTVCDAPDPYPVLPADDGDAVAKDVFICPGCDDSTNYTEEVCNNWPTAALGIAGTQTTNSPNEDLRAGQGNDIVGLCVRNGRTTGFTEMHDLRMGDAIYMLEEPIVCGGAPHKAPGPACR